GGDGKDFPEYVEWLAKKGLVHKMKPWTETTRMVLPPENHIGVLDLPNDATVPYFLVDNTIEMIDDFKERDKPFFISLNFWGPHGPCFATQEFVDMYNDVKIPPWPNYEWDAKGTVGTHQYKLHWDQDELSWEDWEVAVRYYYARTSMIDDQIGRLYDYLAETGLLEETVIIFTSDHGETMGSHGGLLDKGWIHFEEVHRIPMIIRMPDGESKGETREEYASLVDMYPTILDLAGVDESEVTSHGQSLVPLVKGESVTWRDSIVTEFLGLGGMGHCMKTIRVGDLKYGYNLTYRGELYDLDQDPHEMNNLIDDPAYAETIEEMKDRLVQWMTDTQDPALSLFEWHRGKRPDNLK
ncbi:sulfatase-like hydrolase/transferase, partial [Candidatus Hydrogenedentota bacterium]